ncbi:MAG: AAA family ATPase [Candidatus Methanoperedens sp.]
MLIIGTCARCGSGQDALAREISLKLNLSVYSMGDIVRSIAKKKNYICSRENLQNIRKHCDEKYGRSYFSEILSKEILSKNESAIITGIRTLEEVDTFNKYFNKTFYLVFVYADELIRFNRLLKRNEEKDPKNYSEFNIQMENEKRLFDIDELELLSDHKIDCNMTLGEMKSEIDSIIQGFYFLHVKNNQHLLSGHEGILL